MIPFSLHNTLIYTFHIAFFLCVYENKHILILNCKKYGRNVRSVVHTIHCLHFHHMKRSSLVQASHIYRVCDRSVPRDLVD